MGSWTKDDISVFDRCVLRSASQAVFRKTFSPPPSLYFLGFERSQRSFLRMLDTMDRT